MPFFKAAPTLENEGIYIGLLYLAYEYTKRVPSPNKQGGTGICCCHHCVGLWAYSVREYVFYVFFQISKKTWLFTFFERLHTFSRTLGAYVSCALCFLYVHIFSNMLIIL